jgi:hypothetical protein
MHTIAIVEPLDGKTVDGMAKLSNEQSQARKAHP